mmetsp:Transcript_61/g.161  ORF Transcript_61/g.161 Transcript_61/m.161 type:complete len:311 (-) Transcript_61:890-1822(-)
MLRQHQCGTWRGAQHREALADVGGREIRRRQPVQAALLVRLARRLPRRRQRRQESLLPHAAHFTHDLRVLRVHLGHHFLVLAREPHPGRLEEGGDVLVRLALIDRGQDLVINPDDALVDVGERRVRQTVLRLPLLHGPQQRREVDVCGVAVLQVKLHPLLDDRLHLLDGMEDRAHVDIDGVLRQRRERLPQVDVWRPGPHHPQHLLRPLAPALLDGLQHRPEVDLRLAGTHLVEQCHGVDLGLAVLDGFQHRREVDAVPDLVDLLPHRGDEVARAHLPQVQADLQLPHGVEDRREVDAGLKVPDSLEDWS